jgi:hypothetical protein
MMNFTWLSDEDDAVLRAITSRDWRSEALTLGDAADEELAAKALALGALACTPFGNVYALVAHADPIVVRHANQLLGLNADLPGSLTTVRERLPGVFDWSHEDRGRVLQLADRLLDRGPVGFRGPGAAHLGAETVQIVMAGRHCPSNRLVERCLQATGDDYLYAAFAQPAPHYRLSGMQQDFGASAGVLMFAPRDAACMTQRYARYVPTAPTIVELQAERLIVHQHGSLTVDDLREIAAEIGVRVDVDEAAQQGATLRRYEDDEDLMVA